MTSSPRRDCFGGNIVLAPLCGHAYDITGDIMTPKKIEELRLRVEVLRRQSQIPSRELQSLAEAVGRSRSKRGKHPIYEMPGRPSLAIPNHSRPMPRYTKDSILAMLEDDLGMLEEDPS